jgi:hypothetical protein
VKKNQDDGLKAHAIALSIPEGDGFRRAKAQKVNARKLLIIPFLVLLAAVMPFVPVLSQGGQRAVAATNMNGPTCPGITPASSGANPTLPYKFDFGSGAAATGYTKILPMTAYSAAHGYGFASAADLVAVNRGAPNTLLGDFITSSKPFTFETDLPNGNYNVTV